MRRQRFDIQEPQVNMTPLIDVVFVLLISFIVIAPILEIDRIQLASAQPNITEKIHHSLEAGPIQIHVYEDNKITLNKKVVMLSELSILLQDAKVKNPTARPQLFHDKQAYFGTYQKIKNILESCGFQELDILLSP